VAFEFALGKNRRTQSGNQAEQLRLLEQIAVLIRSKATVKTRRSILELQEMGKNMWKNIDAQEYVNKENFHL